MCWLAMGVTAGSATYRVNSALLLSAPGCGQRALFEFKIEFKIFCAAAMMADAITAWGNALV